MNLLIQTQSHNNPQDFSFLQDMDLKALGFDVAEGVNDPYLPGDYGVFVTKVDKGSIAEGRLR